MNIVFFGSTKYSVIAAKALHNHFGLTATVTLNDRPDPHTKKNISNPVKFFSLQHEIPCITTDILTAKYMQRIVETKPDFIIVLDYGLILPKRILTLPSYAALNIHPSLLPKYRGPSPVPSAILAGETVSGVTIIEMTNEVDAGNMLAQKEYILKSNETTESLLTILDSLGGQLTISVINDYLNGTITKTPQDHKKATFTQKYQKSDGYVDLENPPDKQHLDRMIRAFYPWLNVWTIITLHNRNMRIKLLPEKKVQVEGKNPINLKDFFNGYPEMKQKFANIFE